MPRNNPRKSRLQAESTGFVVLGMHRSGTSALARLLHEAGASVGSRVLPGSAGNEEGHWEDAFAVETNERLLAELGSAWNDARALPENWLHSEAATRSRHAIVDYLRSSRLRETVWAIKDPRMCLLADLWFEAMAEVGIVPNVLLIARHPREVSASLSARDGTAPGVGMLAWVRHTLSAERASRSLPRIALTYDQLLADPGAVLAELEKMPEGSRLVRPAAKVLSKAIRSNARHQVAEHEHLPPPLNVLWEEYKALASGAGDLTKFDAVLRDLDQADNLFGPVLGELHREQAVLWQRTARAEGAIAGSTFNLGDLPDAVSRIVPEVGEMTSLLGGEITGRMRQLQEEVDALGTKLVEVVSVDLRRMQDEHARAIEAASSSGADARLAREMTPRLEQLESGLFRVDEDLAKRLDQVRAEVDLLGNKMVEAISQDLRRMQGEHARAIEAASANAAEAGLARQMVPRIELLESGIVQVGERIMQVYNDDLRQMRGRIEKLQQEVHAAGMRLLDQEREFQQMLAEREGEIEESRLQLGHQEREFHQMLAEREGEIEELRMQLAHQERELQDVRARHGRELETERQLTAEAATRAAQLDEKVKAGRRRIAVLEADAEMLQMVRQSLSWRITRPLRFARRMLQGGLVESDRIKIRRWWNGQLAGTRLLPRKYRDRALHRSRARMARLPAHYDPSPDGLQFVDGVPVPASREEGREDVFVWAVIDWHFRIQRPQHLARSLAQAGHRVFYVSNNLVDRPEPGFQVEALDGSGRLFQLNLNASGAPPIYHGNPAPDLVSQLRRSIGEAMQWAESDGGLCIVQHPYWSDVASRVTGCELLYDCMDHHAGFENNAQDVLEAESSLIAAADLLIVTSEWLYRELEDKNPSRALIRNACEYEHFCERPAEIYEDPEGRRIIGYYGAIAEWFDVELVRKVAESFPACMVLLVGNDTIGAERQLEGLENVVFTGEVPYERLPYYLHAFDVALLPFRVIPLTLATNPVKVYEYLSAGKPVVAIDLPEMLQFGDLVSTAADHDSFVRAIADVLEAGEEESRIDARQSFARQQTWSHRAAELEEAIVNLSEPRVSVVVLAYNNLDFTRACLHSIEEESNWSNLEVIVVDNASTDSTREFLHEWEHQGDGRKVISNKENMGFSAGNNIGLAAATGDYLILLNNDTYVTPNWIRTLVNHLKRDPGIGIIGPVTNNIGNEARIDIQYEDMQGMRREAARYTRRNLGRVFDIRTVAFFCVAMPRSTYQAVGDLDESFGIGFFEDDDYCRRVEKAGLRVVCADDVFVHHHLSASFDVLKAEAKQELFKRNRAIYEAKWGQWEAHVYRYQDQDPQVLSEPPPHPSSEARPRDRS